MGRDIRPRDVLRLGLREEATVEQMRRELLDAVVAGKELVSRLPAEEMGCFYLAASGQPVCPDPDSPEFSKLTRHFGSVKGAWPRIVEE